MSIPENRRLSALQKKILILALAAESRYPGPLPTKDIERMLESAGDRPVYTSSVRQSCHLLEASGLVRTLRARNLQLAVELTGKGRLAAVPLLDAESQAERERQRQSECRILPFRLPEADPRDLAVTINGQSYIACLGAFVVRLDGTVSLALWRENGERVQLDGDALQVAEWYQVCHGAGLPVRMQVNDGAGML